MNVLLRKVFIIFLTLSGFACSSMPVKKAPPAFYEHSNKRVVLNALGGCWESGLVTKSATCYDMQVDYNEYLVAPELVKQSDSVDFTLPIASDIKAVTYSISKQKKNGELALIKSENVGSRFSIKLAELLEGKYIIDIFVRWSGRRDTYYITGIEIGS